MTTNSGAVELGEVASYRRDGWLVQRDLVPPERIAALRERMQAIAEGRVADFPAGDVEWEPASGEGKPRQVRKINRCAQNDPLFFQHAADPRILDWVESLIGPDIKLYGSQCFMKPPGGVEKPYHQDSAYFAIEPMELVTCWTALDDVTEENGCVWVISGSHRQGLVEHGVWHLGDREDKQVSDALLDGASETPLVMPAGSCSFHHSLLLHRSGPNRSATPRRGLAVHYMPSRCRWTDDTTPRPSYPLLRGREYPGCV